MIIDYDDKYLDSTLEVCIEWANQIRELTGLQVSQKAVLAQFPECKDYAAIIVEDGKCQGVIAGKLTDNTVSKDIIWGEVIYFVRPEYRKQSKDLFNFAEQMLRAKGINAMLMILMCNNQEKLIDRLYRGLGFRPLEKQYIKNI